MKTIFASTAIFFLLLNVNSQELQKDSIDSTQNIRFNYKQLIIPGVLIGYGVIGLNSDQLKDLNLGIREEVTEDIDRKFTIDDFAQGVPALSVYALNAFGVKGKNNFKDRTVIIGTSYLIMAGTVYGLKSLTKVERPDGSSNDSFPSGHTATAFAGAEFLWQEYKDQSVWYGVAGFAVASGTGIFRIVNNRHWLTDVAAGAGIGIMSTKIAYWINPFINRNLFPGRTEGKKTSSIMMPFYNGKEMGCAFAMSF